MQGSKKETTRVFPLCKNCGKNGNDPFTLIYLTGTWTKHISKTLLLSTDEVKYIYFLSSDLFYVSTFLLSSYDVTMIFMSS